MVDLIFTNFLTLMTEFVGIVAGAGYFGIPKWAAVSGSILLISGAYLFRRYSSWEKIVLGFALFNLIFIPVAILAHPNWGSIGSAFLTFLPLPGGFGSHTIMLLLADIGATITPWMLFFQQGAVTDKGLSVQDVKQGRIDTALGSLLAALAAIATIIATAPLYLHHMNASQFGAAQFAQALQPYIGHVGAAMFALGILEAGLVAATTISTSSAYAFGEVSQKAHSLNRPFREAKGFYFILFAVLVVAGAIVVIPGFPLEMVVIIVNVLAVLTMPPAIGFLLILANDKGIMGKHANTLLFNILGISIGIFISLAGVIYALTVIFPGFQL